MGKPASSDLDDTIRSILAAHGHLVRDVDTLDENEDLYRAGLRSHATVDVMLAVEDAFAIEFPDHMFRKSTFHSVSAIRSAVVEVIGAEVSS
jgi:acyl carrier protein